MQEYGKDRCNIRCTPLTEKSTNHAGQDISGSTTRQKGLPLPLINIFPSGVAITVGAPLRTRITPYSRAKSAATASRSASISATVQPRSRAISPGWGVKIVAPTRFSSCRDRETTHSARQHRQPVALLADRGALNQRMSPFAGPESRAYHYRLLLLASEQGATQRVRNNLPSLSARREVITSVSLTSRIGFSEAGQASVDSPAPARKPASEANTAAPVLPGDPAMVSK